MDRTVPPKDPNRAFDAREHIRRVEEAAIRRLRRERRTPPPPPGLTPPKHDPER